MDKVGPKSNQTNSKYIPLGKPKHSSQCWSTHPPTDVSHTHIDVACIIPRLFPLLQGAFLDTQVLPGEEGGEGTCSMLPQHHALSQKHVCLSSVKLHEGSTLILGVSSGPGFTHITFSKY